MKSLSHIALLAAAFSFASLQALAEAPYAVVLPVPAKGGEIPVRVTPSRVVLGDDTEVKVTVAVPDGVSRVRLFVSAGSIVKSSFESPTRLVAKYVPPESFIPRVDVVMALVDTRDGPAFGFAAIQLIGQGEAVIKTRPNVSARITIGDHEYGPAQADKKGEARIRIRVPPGTNVGYDENRTEIDLGVPPMPRIALFLPQDEIGMDAPAPIPVYAVVTKSDGGTDDVSLIAFSTDLGSISPPRALGGGAFTAMYTPPFEAVGGKPVVTASIKGETLPFAAAELALVPSLAASDEWVSSRIAASKETDDRPPGGEDHFAAVHGLDTALKLGFAWNMGTVTTFGMGLDAAYAIDLPSIGLRAGMEIGFSRSSAEGNPELDRGATVNVKSTLWMMPLAFFGGCRLPLAEDWALLLRAEFDALLVDNSLRENTDDLEIRERKWMPALGGALEIDRALGPGAVVAELRYLYIFGDMETVEGRLATLYINVGYRLAFPRK